MAMFYAMLLCFGLSLFLSFRGASSSTAFACSIAPFVFGSTAMWLGVGRVSAMISNVMNEYDPLTALHEIQQPFFLGSALSIAALFVYFLARAFHSKTRNASSGTGIARD